MKTKHFFFAFFLISVPVWTQTDPCGEGGAATVECACNFNRDMNEMQNDYQSDVRECAGFMHDPAFFLDMLEAYTSGGAGAGFGASSEMAAALDCINEAVSDMGRQADTFGNTYQDCMGRYGC